MPSPLPRVLPRGINHGTREARKAGCKCVIEDRGERRRRRLQERRMNMALLETVREEHVEREAEARAREAEEKRIADEAKIRPAERAGCMRTRNWRVWEMEPCPRCGHANKDHREVEGTEEWLQRLD